jgi:hypothetical protein
MPHAQASILPPALRQPGLFAHAGRVAKEDLAGDRKHIRVREAFEERRQEIGRHPHIAVQQHHDAIPGGANAGVGAAAKAQVLGERQQPHLRKPLGHEGRAAVGGTIVHHHDFVPGVAGQRGNHRRQVLLQQVFAVPVGDHD